MKYLVSVIFLVVLTVKAETITVSREVYREETVLTTVIQNGKVEQETGNFIVYSCNEKNCKKP